MAGHVPVVADLDSQAAKDNFLAAAGAFKLASKHKNKSRRARPNPHKPGVGVRSSLAQAEPTNTKENKRQGRHNPPSGDDGARNHQQQNTTGSHQQGSPNHIKPPQKQPAGGAVGGKCTPTRPFVNYSGALKNNLTKKSTSWERLPDPPSEWDTPTHVEHQKLPAEEWRPVAPNEQAPRPFASAAPPRDTPKYHVVQYDHQMKRGVPQFRAPRIKFDTVEDSEHDDLASVCVRDLSDPGEAIGDLQQATRRDIRNTMAPAHRIEIAPDGTWRTLDLDWSNNCEKIRDEWNIGRFILDWAQSTPESVPADFLEKQVPGHWDADIDTLTGKLLPPVEYPSTRPREESISSPEAQWRDCRRQYWTAAMGVDQYLQRACHAGASGPLPPPTRAAPKIRLMSLADLHESVPKVPCHLRPVRLGDLAHITAMYEAEVARGGQTLDVAQPTEYEWEVVYEEARRRGMPFIVAVGRSYQGPRQPSKSRSVISARHPQVNHKMAGTKREDVEGKILGFIFLSCWNPGISARSTGSSTSARVYVLVHPAFRNKNIGSSLLDMVLSTVSTLHKTSGGYDFCDAENNPTYWAPLQHKRRYYRLYGSFLKRNTKFTPLMEDEGRPDPAILLGRIRKLLVDRFGFKEKVTFEAVSKTSDWQGKWYTWVDEVLFEYTCHADPDDTRVHPDIPYFGI